jgi:flavin reductase (DIM6/NTAB) family NADH-FMN oxidoreductase RutF
MSSKTNGQRPARVDKAEFCRTCAKFPTGVTVLTVRDAEGGARGMTASSFTSVSLDPPLVLVCVDHKASVMAHLRRSRHVGINILREEQSEISIRFARRGEDRFQNIEWTEGHHSVPLIQGVLAWLECEIDQMVDAGDHAIVIAEVLRAEYRDGRPLVYFGSAYHKLETASE